MLFQNAAQFKMECRFNVMPGKLERRFKIRPSPKLNAVPESCPTQHEMSSKMKWNYVPKQGPAQNGNNAHAAADAASVFGLTEARMVMHSPKWNAVPK